MPSRILTVAPLLIVCSLLTAGCRTSAAKPDEVATRLDTMFAALHQQGLFDGAVVIGRGERVLWSRGFGLANASSGARFTADTPTDAASLAKTFTAALLVALEREGRLSLDEPAQRFLPELPYADITLRQLVSHSSGLPSDYGYFDRYVGASDIRTTEVLLGVVQSQKPALAFTPGTAFEYNSFGFDLAALAAARVTGKSYGDLLAERFFKPLGMTSAFLRPGRLDAFPSPRTLAYRRAGDKLELHDVYDLEAFHGGSNIYVSAADLFRWNAAFFGPLGRHSELFEDARIGGQRSGLTLGSWYRSADGKQFWYSGHLQGFHSVVYRDLGTQASVVYATNNTLAPWLQHWIVRASRRILAGEDVPSFTPPATSDLAKAEYALLNGRWQVAHEGIEIEAGDGALKVRHNDVRYAMFPVAKDAFYAPGLDWMIGFAKDASGAIVRIHRSTNVDAEWGSRP
ncbi:MAG TPA: serine hydrolase domain-containing protein [Thermoanaerobaculia bacterium]|nr:serine hydrolase domain-containing protein [Thermoanaerobaculia bacterium]